MRKTYRFANNISSLYKISNHVLRSIAESTVSKADSRLLTLLYMLSSLVSGTTFVLSIRKPSLPLSPVAFWLLVFWDSILGPMVRFRLGIFFRSEDPARSSVRLDLSEIELHYLFGESMDHDKVMSWRKLVKCNEMSVSIPLLLVHSIF